MPPASWLSSTRPTIVPSRAISQEAPWPASTMAAVPCMLRLSARFQRVVPPGRVILRRREVRPTRLGRADARQLFGRGDAGRHLGDPVLPHVPHPVLPGGLRDLVAGGLLGGEELQAGTHLEQLEDADAAPIAGLAAAGA